MQALWESVPLLMAMALLIGMSAFFSASEAALFYLGLSDRRALASGTRAQRIAERLLRDPDRLLSAVLFWNLVVNIVYFTIASIVGLRIEERAHAPPGAVALFAMGSLLLIIFFSEMLPKTFAVMQSRWLAGVVGIPLATAVALVDPIMSVLRSVNLFSRRLVWPNLTAEAPLEFADLERAIEVSSEDRQLAAQEQTVLQNIVQLSDLQVREWMRPRRSYRPFKPPIAQADLLQHEFPSGYLLVTDAEGEDIVSSLPIHDLAALPSHHLERFASPTSIVPWCSSVAAALQQLQEQRSEVATVVNELGETIGVITLPDILDAVFTVDPKRGQRLLQREPIHQAADGAWHAEGVTNLRQLARHFEIELPESHHSTLEGVVEEALERLPVVGDRCDWGPLSIEVVAPPDEEGSIFKVAVQQNEEGQA